MGVKNCIAVVVLFAITSCRTATTCYEEALRLDEKGEYIKAIALLDEAIAKRHDYIDALLQRGYDKMQIDKNKEAEHDFETVLTYDPENTLAYCNLGCAKRAQKQWQAALHYFDAAIKTKGGPFLTIDRIDNNFAPDPKARYDVSTAEITYQQGIVYYSTDSLGKAYRAFKYAADKECHKADALYYMAVICFVCNKNVEGCGALNQAILFGYQNADPKYLSLCGM